MNKRKMKCGLEIFAVGMEESPADIQEKARTCKECQFAHCADAGSYLGAERDYLESEQYREKKFLDKPNK